MAKEPKTDDTKIERFHLVAKAFIGGSLIDPADPIHKGRPVYVMLPSGSKAPHLVPAPDGYTPGGSKPQSQVPLFTAGPNPVAVQQPGVAPPPAIFVDAGDPNAGGNNQTGQ